MLVRQHACGSRLSSSCTKIGTRGIALRPAPPAAAATVAARRRVTAVTRVATPSSSSGAGIHKRGQDTPSAAAVETMQTTQQGSGAPAQKAGKNLARWLVNETDSVKLELEQYSKDFLAFWKDQRAVYWQQVAAAKQAFDNEQKKSDGSSDKHFIQPPLQQLEKASYAEKHPFIEEVIKYGEMVQAVYDTLETKDVYSRFFGGCKAGAMKEGSTLSDNNRKFINVGEAAAKYKIIKQMEADSGAYKLVIKEGRNYVGFIAQGPADSSKPADSKEVDLAVVFRGTITKDEWLQDAKVLQVRWNNGSAIAQSPRIFLRALPFQPTGKAFAGTLALSLLALWAIKAKTGALPAGVAAVDHWVKTSLSTAAGAAPNFLQALFGVTINADTGPLLFSAALATAVWLFNGFATACIAHPNHWLRDMRTLVLAVGPWLLYGARLLTDTLISSFAGLKGDPLVSYGFKQMYSDAKDDAASPRLTILTTLTEQLERLSKDGKVVHSIHVTGHSLGGALASLCSYDLSTTVAEALAATEDPQNSKEYKALKEKMVEEEKKNKKPDLITMTAVQRIRFMSVVWNIKDKQGDKEVPVVAGITFAAPRVGNAAYANAFKARSLVDPLLVREPLFDSSYNSSLVLYDVNFALALFFSANWLLWFWLAEDRLRYVFSLMSLISAVTIIPAFVLWRMKPGQLDAVFRDIWLLLKHIWFRVGTAEIANDAKSRAAEEKKNDGQARSVVGGMLRIVNVHDVVPVAPPAVPVPFFRYVHGGQELLVNSLYVPYYRAGQFTGAAIGARHNLEQHLHTLDPTRAQALVNKDDDVLLSSYCVPSCWWNPVPNRGMEYDVINGRGVWMRKEQLDDMKAQQKKA